MTTNEVLQQLVEEISERFEMQKTPEPETTLSIEINEMLDDVKEDCVSLVKSKMN